MPTFRINRDRVWKTSQSYWEAANIEIQACDRAIRIRWVYPDGRIERATVKKLSVGNSWTDPDPETFEAPFVKRGVRFGRAILIVDDDGAFLGFGGPDGRFFEVAAPNLSINGVVRANAPSFEGLKPITSADIRKNWVAVEVDPATGNAVYN